MKTGRYLFCVIVLLFTFASCDDTPTNELFIERPNPTEEPYTIVVESFIQDKSNRVYPDYNADVFIYWGIYSADIRGLGDDFFENGTLIIRRDSILKPYISASLDMNGACKFTYDNIAEEITIIICSKIIPKTVVMSSFSNYRKKIHFNNTFVMN